MECIAQQYSARFGGRKSLDRTHYDTPGSLRGCRCASCTRQRQAYTEDRVQARIRHHEATGQAGLNTLAGLEACGFRRAAMTRAVQRGALRETARGRLEVPEPSGT